MDLNPVIARLGRRLRLGVLGGGPGSFIGEIHRSAARLDDRYTVAAGVFSSDPGRSREVGKALGLDPARCYGDHREMIEEERRRPDGIDVVAIMTPNDRHHAQAAAALDAGLDVICDKPVTTEPGEALDLVRRVRETGLVFCLTHNYTGYPMVRQARAMIRDGVLGEIRMVKAEYVQGHLARPADRDDPGNWRMQNQRAGSSLVLGDIGTHAQHLAAFVTGRELVAVAADLGAVVPGRAVDDYGGLLLRYDNGARGVMWVTQAAAGAEHGLTIRVHGDKGGLEWHQEEPNRLLFSPLGAPKQVMTRGGPGLTAAALRATRVAIGHPEGFHEAFATLYADAAEAIVARRTGIPADPLALDFPTVEDGARGLRFIEAAVASSKAGGVWTDCRLPG